MLALDVLDDPEDGSHYDERARGVKIAEIDTPQVRDELRLRGRRSSKATVEDDSDEDENAEEDDLQEQSSSDDPFADGGGVGFFVLAQDRGAARLNAEREHVAADEDQREESLPDERAGLAVGDEHDPPECDVDGRCRECWRNEDRDRLHDVRSELVVWCFRPRLDPADVPRQLADAAHDERDHVVGLSSPALVDVYCR